MTDWLAPRLGAARSTRPSWLARERRPTPSSTPARTRWRRTASSPGDRVPIALPPGLAFAELLHAHLARRRSCAVPLDPRRAERRARPAAPRPTLALRAELDPHARPRDPHLRHDGAPEAGRAHLGNHDASARARPTRSASEPGDRWLCPLPLHHVGGLAILVRSRDQRHHRRPPRALRRRGGVKATLEAGEVTLVSLVPTMLAPAARRRARPRARAARDRCSAAGRCPRACSSGPPAPASRSRPSTA